MEFNASSRYTGLTDKELVSLVLNPPHNEEAAAYLLYDRYSGLLHKIYKNFTGDFSWYEDCVHELFIHLKGRECDWHALATFQWRSSFGYWLTGVAHNKFLEQLIRMKEIPETIVSVDNDDPEKPTIQLPDGGEESYEREMRKVLLLEAIGQLEDADQRFVILKRLQGYNSKEIAILLQERWKKHGIVKYNNRHEPVVPDAAYVDVRTQRAKENLRKILLSYK